MKTVTLFLFALLCVGTLATFVPVSNYNLSQIQGTWHVQSYYDSTINDWSLAYCLELAFDILNDTAVNLTLSVFDGFRGEYNVQSKLIYPDPSNPAILYQDAHRTLPPLLVVNVSTLPYWVENNVSTTIFVFDYSSYSRFPGIMVFGGSKAYDTNYDIRPYLSSINFKLNYTKDFWLINTACDAHFGWNPLKNFNATNLLKNWNLIGVYDPAGSGLVPWYTSGSMYDWRQAYCANISFTQGKGEDTLMRLSLLSLYQGDFERSWEIIPAPELNSALMGFNMNENTLLYVQYYDKLGNLILTTGTTTSFFLSTTAKTLTPVEKALFELNLEDMGYKVDVNYIYPIDNSAC